MSDVFDQAVSGIRDQEDVDRQAAGDDLGPTSWAPVDLSDAVAGRDLPAPALLERVDGHYLLYRGRVHWFQGEPESCKTWLALLAATQVLIAGGWVLWLDFEDTETGVVARLRALGVPADIILARFVYTRPDEPLRSRDGFTRAIIDLNQLLKQRYDLAVVDGVTEAFTVEGLSYIDNGDVAIWMRLLPKRIADRTGAAVACIDHLTKDREGQGRYAIGGQHKLAGVTGAAYKLEVRRRFKRSADGDPVDGVIAVTVVKDRPGSVQAHAATDDAVATFKLISWPRRRRHRRPRTRRQRHQPPT